MSSHQSPHVVVCLADGFEEIEAVTIVDVLRRADIRVTMAAVGSAQLTVTGSHGIPIVADVGVSDVSVSDIDAVVLPGGQPGATHLSEDAATQTLIRDACQVGKRVAAICAAPMALHAAGVLKGRTVTSYPGVDLPDATYSEAKVVVDGGVTTSRGVGTALGFALELVGQLVSRDKASELGRKMLVDQ